MNIGIDIDNTLTDIEKDMFDAANIYTKTLNPDFEFKEIKKYDGFTNIAEFYSEIFGWDDDNANYSFRNHRIEIVDNTKPRDGVIEVLQKLKNNGNNIYIVTARNTLYDDMPYERAKRWLDNNDIVYDKLIVNAQDKAKTCKEVDIELFVDDQLNNCISLAKNGVYTIRLTNSKDVYDGIININNWNDIYKYIINLK